MQQFTSNISDEEILNLLQNEQNMEQGFEWLVMKYQKQLYAHIRRMVNEHEDANDVIQNTFIKVFKNIKKFERKSQLYTWLYRIATNETITFLNKKKRKATISIDHEEIGLTNQLSATSYFDGNAAQIKLQKAVALLPTKQKLVFNMRYFEEMPYREISEILDTSVGGLKASYHHAVKKIEQFLKDDEN